MSHLQEAPSKIQIIDKAGTAHASHSVLLQRRAHGVFGRHHSRIYYHTSTLLITAFVRLYDPYTFYTHYSARPCLRIRLGR
jgi:hypothetical protein